MTNPNIKTRLDSGQLVRVMSAGALAGPKFLEVAGLVGNMHGVWIDQEHGGISQERLEMMLIACRAAGLDAFARVPPTDYATIMRPMEAGCSGIMAAQIRTIEEVRQVVQWAKFPPIGVRGLFGTNYEAGYGTSDVAEYVKRANEDRWLAIQIETAESVEIVEQIAAEEAVDWIFVGPGDLACNLGVTGQVLHDKCIAALDKVSRAAKNTGKPWGTLSRSVQHAQHCRALGCQLFSLMSDMDIVHRGIQSTREMFADFFDDQTS